MIALVRKLKNQLREREENENNAYRKTINTQSFN